MSYTKVFSSIITSTIWSEDDQTRIVWITMLAAADRHGNVAGSVPGLARIASVPIDACRKALARFMAPDPDSRTKDDEGRRIEEIDGGWHLLNYEKYREMATDEDRKFQAAMRQQRARERRKRNAPVTPPSRQIPQAEAEAEAEAANSATPRTRATDLDEGVWVERIQSAYPDGSWPSETAPCILAAMRGGINPEVILQGTKDAAALIKKNYTGGIANRYVAKARSFFEGRLWENPQTHFPGRQEGNGDKPKIGDRPATPTKGPF